MIAPLLARISSILTVEPSLLDRTATRENQWWVYESIAAAAIDLRTGFLLQAPGHFKFTRWLYGQMVIAAVVHLDEMVAGRNVVRCASIGISGVPECCESSCSVCWPNWCRLRNLAWHTTWSACQSKSLCRLIMANMSQRCFGFRFSASELSF